MIELIKQAAKTAGDLERINSVEYFTVRTSVGDVHITAPTDSELENLFGAASTLPDGWIGIVDDADANTDVFIVMVIGGSFFFEKLTKAI